MSEKERKIKLRKSARQRLEAIILLLGFCIVPWLPRRAVMCLAGLIGRCAYPLMTRTRRIGLANIDVAYGNQLSPQQKERVLRKAYRSSALLLLDVLWFCVFAKHRIDRFVKLDASMEPFFATTPLIGVTAHIGSWEVCGLATARWGAPMLSVAEPLSNRFVDRILSGTRQRTGQRVTTRVGAVRAMLRELANEGRVGLLMDQNVTPKRGGIFVNFFGLPVPVSAAAATLSIRKKAPVMVCACVCSRNGEYTIYGYPPIDAAMQGLSVLEATQAITNGVEHIVRQNPEQWTWMYRRWRYIPKRCSPARYPFYAKMYHDRRKIASTQ